MEEKNIIKETNKNIPKITRRHGYGEEVSCFKGYFGKRDSEKLINNETKIWPYNSELNNLLFENVDLSNNIIRDSLFVFCEFANCNFTEANIYRCLFYSCNFLNCTFKEIKVPYSFFFECKGGPDIITVAGIGSKGGIVNYIAEEDKVYCRCAEGDLDHFKEIVRTTYPDTNGEHIHSDFHGKEYDLASELFRHEKTYFAFDKNKSYSKRHKD